MPSIAILGNHGVVNVVHVMTSTDVGGAQIMIARYLRALGADAEGHSVISLMAVVAVAFELRAAEIDVTDLSHAERPLSIRAVRRLRTSVAARAPDVLHGWMYRGSLAALMGRSVRRDVGPVWGIHHSLADGRNEKPTTRAIVRSLAALSSQPDAVDCRSAVSSAQHERIGVNALRATVFSSAFDADASGSDPGAQARLAAPCGIPPGREIVGNVARTHPMKDHAALVRAVATLLVTGCDVHAVHIGAGQADGPARAEAGRLGIAGRVSCLDARDDVATLMPGFDLFLLFPERSVVLPLSVAEAMAAGVPCVVTNVGDCAAPVGETGTVVGPRDPAAMAERRRAGWTCRRRLVRKPVARHFPFRHDVGAHASLRDGAVRHWRAGRAANRAA